jgi:hypothetical protein
MLFRFCLLLLAGNIAFAQQRFSIRTGAPRFPSRPPAFSTGLPPVGGIPPFGVQPGLRPHTLGFSVGFPHRFGSPRKGGFRGIGVPFGLPLFFSTVDSYPSVPPIIIVLQQQAAAPEKVKPPREPIKPMIREYNFPEESDKRGNTFSIVLADGTELSAIAVWRQDDWLHYVTPAGVARRVLVEMADREATMLRNREKGLTLAW